MPQLSSHSNGNSLEKSEHSEDWTPAKTRHLLLALGQFGQHSCHVWCFPTNHTCLLVAAIFAWNMSKHNTITAMSKTQNLGSDPTLLKRGRSVQLFRNHMMLMFQVY
jgi:hypothetical protein